MLVDLLKRRLLLFVYYVIFVDLWYTSLLINQAYLFFNIVKGREKTTNGETESDPNKPA